MNEETRMHGSSCEPQRSVRIACQIALGEQEAAARATFCVCGEAVTNLEGHLLAHHPDAASRGLCADCGRVAPVGHCSSGAALAEHLAHPGLPGGVRCRGSGRPPHRHLVRR